MQIECFFENNLKLALYRKFKISSQKVNKKH
jgi:hypothetical protein